MEISGANVMITGGARIGRGVALWLARQGVRNFLLTYHRSHDAMVELGQELAALNARAEVVAMDATSETDVQAAINRSLESFDRLDVLINMASIYQSRATEGLTLADWRADLDNNATCTFLCMAVAAPIMRRQGRGRIINFIDWTVASRRVNYGKYAAYYAAKGAVLSLTEAFALDYAPEVLINSIAPGPILPPPDLSAEDMAATAAQTPLQRWGGSDEIAEAVGFFIRTNFVTGECIRVDGGRHLL